MATGSLLQYREKFRGNVSWETFRGTFRGGPATILRSSSAIPLHPERPGARNFQVSGFRSEISGFRFANLKPEIFRSDKNFRFQVQPDKSGVPYTGNSPQGGARRAGEIK